MPGYARALVDAFWPGPLTLVCTQQASLQWDLGDTRGTVAVRMPDHEVALEILERTGPLAVSSANLTGRPAATDADAGRGDARRRRRRDRRRGGGAGRGGLDDRRRDRRPRAGCCAAVRSRLERAQRGARAARRHADGRGLGGHRLCASTLLVFLVAAAVTYLLTVVAREIALRTGAVAEVRDRDVHAEPIPYLGGLAMLGGLVAAYLVARELPFLSTSGPFVFRDAGIVLIAGALICAVGVLDDLFELDALTKLGGQVLAAGFLIFSGIQYTFFPTQDGGQFSLDPAQGALLTVLIVVATVNAVNFVDGLDGLAAGVVGIGATAFFLFCYQLANLNGVSLATTGALLSAALAGACAGFLPHNFHPARLFMGDSGSMLIGLVLSASAVTLSGQFSGERDHPGRRRLAGQPAADAAAAAAAGLDPDRPDRRPAARRRTPHPRRPVALRAGQAAPAPPAARDRPLAAAGRADHVDVGRAGRVRHRAGQPLHGPAGCGSRWPRWRSCTIALTFVLPMLHKPRLRGARRGLTRLRRPGFRAVRTLC